MPPSPPQLRLGPRAHEELEDGVRPNVELFGQQRAGDCSRGQTGYDVRGGDFAGKGEETAWAHDGPPGQDSATGGLINKKQNSDHDANHAREAHEQSADLCRSAAVVVGNPADESCHKKATDTAEEPPPPWQQIEIVHSEENYTPFWRWRM